MTTLMSRRRSRRERLRFRWHLAKHRARARWHRLVAPHLLHPEELHGYDGEPPHFLRHDLARDAEGVIAYFLREWQIGRDSLGYEANADDVEIVWMRPHASACTDGSGGHDEEDADCERWKDDEGWYDPVDPGAAGATRYWRWNAW